MTAMTKEAQMKVHDHEWNEHPDDLGLPDDERDFTAALRKGGWDAAWKVGDDDGPSIAVYAREDDWLVEAFGDGYSLALVRCAHPGQILKVLRDLEPLVTLGRNLWQLPGAPIADQSVRTDDATGKAHWANQSYLVTTADDAREVARRWAR